MIGEAAEEHRRFVATWKKPSPGEGRSERHK
jgi:hypothetical protein